MSNSQSYISIHCLHLGSIIHIGGKPRRPCFAHPLSSTSSKPHAMNHSPL